METYVNRIHMHLEHYVCEHYGKCPKVIFMSTELFYRLSVYDNAIAEYFIPDGAVYMFHGVPIKVYYSSNPEYYFAESGGELD